MPQGGRDNGKRFYFFRGAGGNAGDNDGICLRAVSM